MLPKAAFVVLTKKPLLLLPFVVLCFLGVFLFKGLWLDPKKLPSALINKPVPDMHLPVLSFDDKLLQVNDLKNHRIHTDFLGQKWVLNVFASWCKACLLEHPKLMSFSRQKKIKLIGLAYKDDLNATRSWLAQHGNPYDLVLVDQDGQYGIELGVYGVPETFVMNANNTIDYKQVFPVIEQFERILT